MYLLALVWAVANGFDPYPHKLGHKQKPAQLCLTNVIKIRSLLCYNSIYPPWYPFVPFNFSYGHNDQITQKFSVRVGFTQLFINKRICFSHLSTNLLTSELYTLLTQQKQPVSLRSTVLPHDCFIPLLRASLHTFLNLKLKTMLLP